MAKRRPNRPKMAKISENGQNGEKNVTLKMNCEKLKNISFQVLKPSKMDSPRSKTHIPMFLGLFQKCDLKRKAGH